MKWSWGWLPSEPPAHFGDNIVFDFFRLGVVLASIMLFWEIFALIRERRREDDPLPWIQVARFISLALGVMYVAVTEVAVFGTVATVRLFIGFGMDVFGWYGVHSMREKQTAVKG